MFLSIITVNFNNIVGLRNTIESVDKQDDKSFLEMIVIDANSSDGSKEYLETCNLPFLKWVSEPDRGISDGFNKGVMAARGDLLFFLNSGDTFIGNNVISNVKNKWQETSVDLLSYKVKVSGKKYIPHIDNEEILRYSCEFPHQGTFISRSVFNRVGMFSEGFKIRMDYDFFARCMYSKCSYCYIPETIVNFELNGISMKKTNIVLSLKEGLAVKLINNMKLNILDCFKILFFKFKLTRQILCLIKSWQQ